MAGKVGGSGGGRGKFSTNAEPNVIPFIDIMLVMLIIFMVAAPKPTVDIKVDLPPPGPQIPSQSVDKPTFVNLEDENGVIKYYVEGEEVELSKLQQKLDEIVPKRSPGLAAQGYAKLHLEAKVYVQADQETEYKNVIELMGAIGKANFQKVSLVAVEAQLN